MFLVSAVVVLFALASPSSSSSTVAWKKTFTLTGQPQVRVASNNVDVRVFASDRKDIEAVLYTDRTISLGAVIDHESSNRVELEVKIPNQWDSSFNHKSAVLELKIPQGCDLEVDSGSGSILAKGTEGKATLRTEHGNIEAVGISGTLDVESGHGDLQVNGTLTAVGLHTRTGNIAARIDAGSKMNSTWFVRTGDGNVDLRLPENFCTDLDVQSGNGDVRLDFPMAMIGGGRQSSVRGPINGGGQRLEVHSDKGNIMVRKIGGSA
jgi:DUF4097 and DUF4098 domain-containing protein YvlB